MFLAWPRPRHLAMNGYELAQSSFSSYITCLDQAQSSLMDSSSLVGTLLLELFSLVM